MIEFTWLMLGAVIVGNLICCSVSYSAGKQGGKAEAELENIHKARKAPAAWVKQMTALQDDNMAMVKDLVRMQKIVKGCTSCCAKTFGEGLDVSGTEVAKEKCKDAKA